MTISSALNAGVAGLGVNSTRLGTIADNIANSDTNGYKRSAAEFQSQVVSGRTAQYSAGGVRATVVRDVEAQGALLGTGNNLDLTVAGRGMLPVTNESGTDPLNTSPEFMMVPTGSFTPDSQGFLRTASGLYLMGFLADSLGEVGAVDRNTTDDLVPVQLTSNAFASTPTRNVGLGVNLPSSATEAGFTFTEPFVATPGYYDNLGESETLSVSFTPVVPTTGASNTWTVEVVDNGSQIENPVGSGNFEPVTVATFEVEFADNQTNGGTILEVRNTQGFNVDGTPSGTNIYDSTTGELAINVSSGDLNLFIGQPASRSGLTQFAANFSPYSLSRDGAQIGNLVSAEVDAQGNLQAIYDNSFRQVLYKIPVVDVASFNGLEALDAQAFRVSQESGDFTLEFAGDGQVGEIAGNTLMESTVDIATELTNLIETQRAYSSNAKIIQTVDEMLQETTNIIR